MLSFVYQASVIAKTSNWRSRLSINIYMLSTLLCREQMFEWRMLKSFLLFKGNTNFQGLLNWILQILLYHCSKQHKNIENLLFIEQNIVISFCPSLCLLRLVLSPPFSTANIFQFLDTVLCEILKVTSEHSCRCIKKTMFTTTSVYVISDLQI